MKEKKDPATLEAFFSLSFFSFSSSVTHAFPSPIKGEAGHPMKGGDGGLDIRAQHEHTAERQASSQHPFSPSTRDLGSSPPLPVCNPYYKPSADNTTNSELYIGTFCPN